MATTRMVIAVMAMGAIAVGLYLLRRDQDRRAAWTFFVGFVLASIWGLMTVALADSGRADIPRDGAVMLTSTAVALAVYYGFKAVNKDPIPDLGDR